MTSRKKLILGTVSDLAGNFMYYDRKEDEDLGKGEIEDAIAKGEITVQEIGEHFIKSTGLINEEKTNADS